MLLLFTPSVLVFVPIISSLLPNFQNETTTIGAAGSNPRPDIGMSIPNYTCTCIYVGVYVRMYIFVCIPRVKWSGY